MVEHAAILAPKNQDEVSGRDRDRLDQTAPRFDMLS